ncbi:hypothetical protein ABPG74_020060 [Tetrahymena malaccensis]
MNIRFYLLFQVLKLALATQCQNNQVYDVISQQCLQCPISCLNCFNINYNSCIQCDQHFYQSSQNTSTCQKSCLKGEIYNENQKCIQCQVSGCINCDENQVCLQCDSNLFLDQQSNTCKLQKDYCSYQLSYISSPYSQNECQQSCPQSYYQNEITKVCEKVNKCLQIQNQQILHLDQIAYQIELINENQYLVRTKECTFLLIDQNLNVISVQVLQNDPIFEAQNMIYGVELIQKSFIVGTYGGCSINNSLVVMDFKTLNIVFNQTNIVYDLGVYFVDQADKIVLFGTLQIFKLFWYDAVTQKLNQIDVNFNFVGSIVLWQNITNTYYFIRISQNGYTMNNGAISNLNINPPNINSGIQMQFYLKCDQNLLVVYYPVLQIVDLLTGQYSEKFIKFNQYQLQNIYQSIPLVDLNQGLIIFFSQPNKQYFYLNGRSNVGYIFQYKRNSTNLYFDADYQMLIGVTGEINQINFVNTTGDFKYFTYQTSSQFTKEASYYYKNQNMIIVVDSSPVLYLCNYLTQNVTTFTIMIKETQGIIMDEFKNIIFLYKKYFISAFQFPSIQFIETISITDFSTSYIQQIFINSELSILIVQTQTSIISFDLTEILYASETNILQYQNIQNMVYNQDYQIYYSTVNFSLNLFKNTLLVDTILYDISPYSIYPYFTQIISISQNTLIYFIFNKLNIVQVDILNEVLNISQQLKLQDFPDNYFYDKQKNQIFILYERNTSIYQIDLFQNTLQEAFSTNFTETQLTQSLIFSDNIVLVSQNMIETYNFNQNQKSQIQFQNNQSIKHAIKLQTLHFEDYSNNFWNIPFANEDRQNFNDPQSNESKLLCLLIQQASNLKIQILNIVALTIFSEKQLQNDQIITNIVNDPFRQLIYAVNNIGTTQIFNYSLQLITEIQNGCLKQAIISYDDDFIYSICPNDIIIYNGLSFVQQFPKIKSGIKEATNFINTKYNNYFLIIQKQKFSIIKMDFKENYQLIYEVEQSFQLLIKKQITKDFNQQVYLELLLASYDQIQSLIIPMEQNQMCFINIQQQNRYYESIYTYISLNQSLTQLQSQNQKLSLIDIQYQDNQCIQSIYFNEISNIDSNKQITLISQASSQYVNVCWQDRGIYSPQIKNFYIKNMNLQILDEIILNNQQQMKYFQMFNVTLNLEKSLILSNFDQVVLQNIIFNHKSESSQIIISNCQLVVIEGISIEDALNYYLIFNLTNNANVQIKLVQIQNSNNSSIFLLNNNLFLEISEISLSRSNSINAFQIQQTSNLNISNISINLIQQSQIINVEGSKISYIQGINLNESKYVQLITIQTLELDNQQIACKLFNISNINLTNSQEIYFYLEATTTQISNVIAKQLMISQVFIEIICSNLQLDTFHAENAQLLAQNQNNKSIAFSIIPKIIQIQVSDSCSITNLNFTNNYFTALQISQYIKNGNIKISNAQFINFATSNSLVELNNIGDIQLDNIKLENNTFYNNTFSSLILINQCNQVNITNSQFKSNTNVKGLGGSIYATDNNLIYIQNSVFQKNKCLQLNGGAINIINSINLGLIIIQKSLFIDNQAKFSTGGAINLQNINLKIEDSNVTSNQALIGGGIFYSQVIPDFVINLYNGQNNNNFIQTNLAKVYGKNIGSTLRSISLNQKDISTTNGTVQQNENREIEIRKFKSGDFIQFKKIQLLDEENNPVSLEFMSEDIYSQCSSDVQAIVQQISISLKWDLTDLQIQCSGQIQTKEFINDGFNLNGQIMYKPLSQINIQIVSNIFPQLLDSKGNIYLNQRYLQKDLLFYFSDCSIGDIVKTQGNSVICDQCSDEACQAEAPYSKFNCITGYIGPLCSSCDIYGELWGDSYSQIFQDGKCYKCSESTLQIFLQNFTIFFVIFLYIVIIQKNIISKLQTKLVGHFINRSGMLFLGSSLCHSDKPQILSKILTDHFQMISLLIQFLNSLPNYFKTPVQVSGNSLSVTSKSIDCLFSKYPSLKPLWLYQSLWSFALPVSFLLFYALVGFIYHAWKKNRIILKYFNTTFIFLYFYFFNMVIIMASRSINCIQIADKRYLDLDVTIQCYDPHKHLPFIFYYSLPILIFWILVVPFFLIYQIRKGKKQKWSIFIEIKYSFIFAGYKDKLFYWEFWKLIYKTVLILISILLQQSNFLRALYSLKIQQFTIKINPDMCSLFKLNIYLLKHRQQKFFFYLFVGFDNNFQLAIYNLASIWHSANYNLQ